MAKKTIEGTCRICNEFKTLTAEHVIPRSAGGGTKIKLYTGDELFKTVAGKEKPYGAIRQNGHAVYTLCADCNNASGRNYDEDFANFFNVFTNDLPSMISVPKDENATDFLEGKTITVIAEGIKPLNIAKRILVSFCSVEHPGLTERYPEIKKAILDKNYRPSTDEFSIYLSLHTGNIAFYGYQALLLSGPDGHAITEGYAGIETEMLAFYLAPHNEHLKGGNLSRCLDITPWLTRYAYDEVKDIKVEPMFNKSLTIRFPLPEYK